MMYQSLGTPGGVHGEREWKGASNASWINAERTQPPGGTKPLAYIPLAAWPQDKLLLKALSRSI